MTLPCSKSSTALIYPRKLSAFNRHLFDLASPQPRPMLSYDLWLAFLETGTVVTLCVAIVAFQIRRMEVVS